MRCSHIYIYVYIHLSIFTRCRYLESTVIQCALIQVRVAVLARVQRKIERGAEEPPSSQASNDNLAKLVHDAMGDKKKTEKVIFYFQMSVNVVL